jgi:cell division protein ZapB
MSISLDQFERKVDQMVAICASLRSENQDLRAHVASLEAEKAALAKKIEVTAGRLESLLERLPEE